MRPSGAEQWSWREGEEAEVERGRARGQFGDFQDNTLGVHVVFLRESR
jgi:hypothetical protein